MDNELHALYWEPVQELRRCIRLAESGMRIVIAPIRSHKELYIQPAYIDENEKPWHSESWRQRGRKRNRY